MVLSLVLVGGCQMGLAVALSVAGTSSGYKERHRTILQNPCTKFILLQEGAIADFQIVYL